MYHRIFLPHKTQKSRSSLSKIHFPWLFWMHFRSFSSLSCRFWLNCYIISIEKSAIAKMFSHECPFEYCRCRKMFAGQNFPPLCIHQIALLCSRVEWRKISFLLVCKYKINNAHNLKRYCEESDKKSSVEWRMSRFW